MFADPGRDEERLDIVAHVMRVDAATAEVFRSFDAAGVDARLLKGASLARWLYDSQETRFYRDSDLLVAPGREAAAGEALAGLGFARQLADAGMPDWGREHASEWWREADGVLVDVHRNLPGVGAAPEAAWSALSEPAEELVVAGRAVRGLAAPARALHVVLHAAQHGTTWGRPLDDLDRLLARVDDDVLGEAASLAERLAAAAAFASGLRLLPAGQALIGRLGLAAARSVDAELRAGTAPRQALGFEELARTRGAPARLAFVWRKLFPPAAFMRHWWPPAAERRSELVLAYVWRRPVWLMRAAPAAFRAWRQARRDVRR